jgi:16S rRNA (guanine527-N7)-methyltransferase
MKIRRRRGEAADAAADGGEVHGGELLRRGLRQLRVPGEERVLRLLQRYLAEIGKWNPHYGFVKAAGDELIVKHVLDSLAAWPVVAELASAGTVVDIGSGAGFPGIPLAAALPGARFTLLERSARRSAFLKNCGLLLGLSNLDVREADMGAASGSFDVATFRAFAPLDRFLRELSRSRLACGSVVAYKGKAERAREELEAARRGGWEGGAEVREVKVPFLEEDRCLVVIRDAPRPRE